MKFIELFDVACFLVAGMVRVIMPASSCACGGCMYAAALFPSFPVFQTTAVLLLKTYSLSHRPPKKKRKMGDHKYSPITTAWLYTAHKQNSAGYSGNH